jgi:hypothetical protein
VLGLSLSEGMLRIPRSSDDLRGRRIERSATDRP